jgi:hypothetical protein
MTDVTPLAKLMRSAALQLLADCSARDVALADATVEINVDGVRCRIALVASGEVAVSPRPLMRSVALTPGQQLIVDTLSGQQVGRKGAWIAARGKTKFNGTFRCELANLKRFGVLRYAKGEGYLLAT